MDCAQSSAIKRIIIKSAAIEKNVSVNCCTSQMVHALDIFFKINFQPAKKPLFSRTHAFFPLNKERSSEVSVMLELMGIQIDTRLMVIQLSQDKLYKLSKAIDAIKCKNKVIILQF